MEIYSKFTVHTYGLPLIYILRVCKDSYQEALEYFKLRLNTNEIRCPVRFDSTMDTIYFPSKILQLEKIEFETGGLWDDKALGSIKHLAFGIRDLLTCWSGILVNHSEGSQR